MKSRKRIFIEIVNIVIYIVIIIFILIAAARIHFPDKFHDTVQSRSFVIVSDSMEPTIKKNSIISVKTNNYNYTNDDIITFKVDINGDGYLDFVTHRIYKIEDDKYYTYSDNEGKVDNWTIKKSDIIGKVRLTIPYIGIVVPVLVKYTLPVTISMLLIVLLLIMLTIKNWKNL